MRNLAILLALAPGPAAAQAHPSGQVDPETARRIVTSIAATVEANYVFPDTGRLVAQHLRNRLAGGGYGAAMTAGQLADRLTADLRAVNGDLHLYVVFSSGDASTAPSAGPRMVMRRPGDAAPPDQLLMARRHNYQIRSADRLAGNVGYISVGQLSARTDEALRAFDAAMQFLGSVDAMIIDLRSTTGGDPRMSDYVASYFLGDSVRTLNSYSRSPDQTWERWTVPVGGRKRPDIPLLLLVGPGTASGTEDFAFIMKQTSRAVLVGEITAGAGRLTRIYPLADGFSVSVSGGRTYDPRTGKEWERAGIAPDLAVPIDEALPRAHAEALTRLIATTPDTTWRRALQWARDGVAARARPAALSAETLRSLAGAYGSRSIVYENGKLWHVRDAVTRSRDELVPIDATTFALGEASRVEFWREAGVVSGFRLMLTPQAITTYPRNP